MDMTRPADSQCLSMTVLKLFDISYLKLIFYSSVCVSNVNLVVSSASDWMQLSPTQTLSDFQISCPPHQITHNNQANKSCFFE